uniref:NADH dehydrogenase [ubiquinone] 1 alpha subcomplex assembly factor 4 n=1 Tax=Sinocyclocheilus anshuiensis TaxID=1608454 RepID=A0A671Q2H4_9TELE
ISNMGSRVTRLMRNFNIENRAHREISKTKPKAAPRHPASSSSPREDIAEEIHQKNDPLLSMLKDIYVESKDPDPQVEEEMQRRALKYSLPGEPYGFCDVTDVPKGKLSLVEALTSVHMTVPEKLAQEYSLDPKDAKALTEFFFPFDIKIIPPKTEETKQIKDS